MILFDNSIIEILFDVLLVALRRSNLDIVKILLEKYLKCNETLNGNFGEMTGVQIKDRMKILECAAQNCESAVFVHCYSTLSFEFNFYQKTCLFMASLKGGYEYVVSTLMCDFEDIKKSIEEGYIKHFDIVKLALKSQAMIGSHVFIVNNLDRFFELGNPDILEMREILEIAAGADDIENLKIFINRFQNSQSQILEMHGWELVLIAAIRSNKIHIIKYLVNLPEFKSKLREGSDAVVIFNILNSAAEKENNEVVLFFMELFNDKPFFWFRL